ncbi:Nramp family divalent metal transporter [Brachybacterium sacelli]|uniref:Mn2+/Fe2+ NRAMP family transporter n=1 Tax=Brachybacterium sacelli TaxID=173364 RepID=A0ABS4X0Y8_9MICO|nr:Nramp family divalent metal transporter [Brachybacterium sacelli]MBP2382112.1 Mn2+/Fe2+ NRAMP family transporter [Brachybacterium sacelli]
MDSRPDPRDDARNPSTGAACEPDPAGGEPPPRWKLIGPGLLVAATGIGAGDLVATLVAGSRFGYALLWAAVAGVVIKIFLVEGAARWTLATGHSIFEGWRRLGRWTSFYFGPYILVWGFVYGATAMSASALPIVALIPKLPVIGDIEIVTQIPLGVFAVLTGLIGAALVWLGHYRRLELIIAALVGLMFVTVVGAAVVTLPNLGEVLTGLIPRIPEGGLLYTLSIAGGVGGTITLAAYGYWLTEKGWSTPRWMRVMRLDNTMAYVISGIFVIAMLIVGAELLYSAGIAVGEDDQGLVDLADVLADRYGEFMAVVFLLGFWASSFSSVLGVWNGVSIMFADFFGAARRLPEGHRDRGIGGRYYRFYILWLTFPPMLLLLLGKPVQVIVAYGVLGSFFMPFLALTLLFLLNSRHVPTTWRNGWALNLVLGVVALLFLVLGVNQLIEAIAGL